MSGKKKNIIDELKCIWMSTNFVEEKLCNNNFDCDNCSFDMEMRKSKHHRELFDNLCLYSEKNIVDDVIDKLNALKTITYPRNYLFVDGFLLKKFLGDTYLFGFNPVLPLLLDNVTSFRICQSTHLFRKGDKFLKLFGDWGSVDVSAPFDFNMESEPLTTGLKKDDGKWIGFIKSGNGGFDVLKNGKDDFLKSIDNVCGNLKKYVKKYVPVGITMYDGGERMKYIFQIIGKENYIKILMQILP